VGAFPEGERSECSHEDEHDGRRHPRWADTGLPGLPLPRWPDPDGTYPPGPGPQVRDHTQLLQLIALGRACTVSPESCRAQLHGDLAAVPVLDAPTVTTVIAWPPHSRSRAVADLIRTATRLQPHRPGYGR
jgi:DNA-binding transcriptional LysR family regulator